MWFAAYGGDLASSKYSPLGQINAVYILRVTATVGEQSAEQWVAFRVAR